MHENIVIMQVQCNAWRLGSYKYNPTQKFHQNFINFEKHQKFSKNPKI